MYLWYKLIETMKSKRVIQRNLPLNTKYTLRDKYYVSIMDGGGTCCANCNKVIARIAIVENTEGKRFDIGFDCLETMLINNELLDNPSVIEYQRIKPMVSKVGKFLDKIKHTVEMNPYIKFSGLCFKIEPFDTDWISFEWLRGEQTRSRENDGIKIKNLDLDFLIGSLKQVYPEWNFYKHQYILPD